MNGPSARSRRHHRILLLLRDRPIARQAELAEALAAEGFCVTQSTLSRDLRELRVLRVPTEAGYRYLPASETPNGDDRPRSRSLTAAEVLEVTANENLVVIRTRVGHASGVAAFIDARRPNGLLATVAGDDTILAVPTRIDRTADLEQHLRALFDQA